MQTCQILLFVYVSVFLVWAPRCLAKKGGGGGDYSGGGYSGGGGSYDDGGDDDSDGSSSGGSGYVPYEPACTTCECKERDQRVKIYSLPGSYYNGTVTVNHVVSANSARDAAAIAQSQTGCPGDDASPKTYSYPALFTVGSNLNSSDTSPIFWNLRAFNPPGQYTGDDTHIFAEWIHIRSSDFASDHWSTGDISSSWPEETHTYWTTNVSNGASDNTWSATATYTAQPQEESFTAASFPNPHFVVRSSNYITLTDVCAYDQELYYSDGTSPDMSPLPLGNNRIFNTVPTLFFDLGASASLQDIGSSKLKYTLSGSVQRQVVSTGQNVYACPADTGSMAYYRTLQPLQWQEADASTDQEDMWNVSASVTLDFEGVLVKENSTEILPNSTSLPVWEQESKITGSVTGSSALSATAVSSAGVRDVKPRSLRVVLLGVLLLGVVLMKFA